MKRLFYPALFCAMFCGLVLVANAFSGPFAARRAARLAAASGCSGSSSAAASCSGSSAGMTYTYVLPAAPPPVAAAPVPPPKPASTPTVPNVLEIADRGGEVSTAGCACGASCVCCSQVKQKAPEAIKPSRLTDGTLVIYGQRMWKWNTAADKWDLVDLPTAPQTVYQSDAQAFSCANGSCR